MEKILYNKIIGIVGFDSSRRHVLLKTILRQESAG